MCPQLLGQQTRSHTLTHLVHLQTQADWDVLFLVTATAKNNLYCSSLIISFIINSGKLFVVPRLNVTLKDLGKTALIMKVVGTLSEYIYLFLTFPSQSWQTTAFL